MKFKKIFLFMPAFLSVGTVFANTSANNEQPNVLVAYFSMQDGNTGDVARAIVDATGGDIYRITVAEPYPNDDKLRKERLTMR